MFEARGYEGARIEDIASEAGVAVPTVYKVFANKRNLLKASVEAAIRGGEAGEVERQAWFREQLEEPTAEGQLRLIARNAGVCTTARGNCSKSYAPRQPATVT